MMPSRPASGHRHGLGYHRWMTAIRVGLIGRGYAGRTFHAPLIEATPGLQLVATLGRDAPHALATGAFDLVVIATPNDSHAPLARAALAAGCHVAVDKPFALDTAEAAALAAQAQAAGRVLSVFHNRRWDNDFLAVQALLAEARLGRLTRAQLCFDRFRPQVRTRWREADGPGAGLWMDLGPHLLDQALQLFGWPQALWADIARQRDGARADDAFCAHLRYAGGLRVTLQASTLAAWPGPRFALHGTAGSARVDGLDPQEEQLKAGQRPGSAGFGRDARTLQLAWGPAAEGAPLQHEEQPLPAGNYLAYYAALRDAVLGQGPVPVPASQALPVMQLLDLGRASAAARTELPTPAPHP